LGLVEQGAAAVLRERHARWFADLVADAAGQYHGPRQTAALDRVQAEHANVLAALDWLQREDIPAAARLASALVWFWIRRDHWQEARAYLERLLAGSAASVPGPEWAELLWAAGSIAWLQGDFPSAIRWVDASVAAARRAGAPAALARALALAGRVAASRGEYAAARELFEEGLPLARQAGDHWSEARHLDGLATVALEQADFQTAAALLETCVEVARAMGDAWTLATVLTTLGDLARSQGDYARARQLYEESLALDEGLGSEPRASVLHNLGYVALHAGDRDRSAALFAESLWLYEARGERRGVAECLVGLASVAAALGQRERAARLFGAAEAALEALGVQLSPSNRADYARGLASAQTGASVAASAAALAAGRGLSLEEAMREAVSVGVPRSGRTPPAPAWAPLTMREREVACLIAGGLSNREIAAQLVITEATAERHIANILAKLGSRSRAHVAAWATARGLAEAPPPPSRRS
jgi:non-specific serine/threonine protein kinase